MHKESGTHRELRKGKEFHPLKDLYLVKRYPNVQGAKPFETFMDRLKPGNIEPAFKNLERLHNLGYYDYLYDVDNSGGPQSLFTSKATVREMDETWS